MQGEPCISSIVSLAIQPLSGFLYLGLNVMSSGQILRDVHSKVFEAAHSLNCLYIIPFIAVSVGKSGMQDMGDSILSRPVLGR